MRVKIKPASLELAEAVLFGFRWRGRPNEALEGVWAWNNEEIVSVASNMYAIFEDDDPDAELVVFDGHMDEPLDRVCDEINTVVAYRCEITLEEVAAARARYEEQRA